MPFLESWFSVRAQNNWKCKPNVIKQKSKEYIQGGGLTLHQFN